MMWVIKNIKTLGIIAVILVAVWLVNSRHHLSKELERQKANYENAIKQQDAQFTEYRFEKNKELQQYLLANTDAFRGLAQKLDETNIKLRHISKIVNTTIIVKDTVINKIDLDSLADKMAIKKPFSIPFKDSISKCFVFKGSIDYDGNNTQINIKERAFNDTINYVYHWERNQWRVLGLFNTRIFGKKILKDTVFSNCATIKTIVIHKK